MKIGERLKGLPDWDTGMLWDEYLDYVPRSHSMQIKRYESIVEDELAPFKSSPMSGKIILLSEIGRASCRERV